MADPHSIDTLELEQIQGNILGGFNKDFQTFLFLNFPNPRVGRQWLSTIIDDVATSDEVLTFDKLFKMIRNRRGEEGTVKSTWMNIAFSFRGLQALEATGLDSFPQAFQDGMAGRVVNEANLLGDVDESDPENWVVGGPGSEEVHALMIIASDTREDRADEFQRHVDKMVAKGVRVLFIQEGETRLDQGPEEVGNEHFGFKDGVSQPGIRGVTDPHPKARPGEGAPGQRLIHPGEFVLGYSKQDGVHVPQDNPNADAATAPEPNPAWTRNGSYLVYRRLRQDVKGFRDFVVQKQEELEPQGLTTDLGANLVGRYRSGCPFEKVKSLPEFDPLQGDPTLGDSPDTTVLDGETINNFRYKNFELDNGERFDDSQGLVMPRAAHIRKAYPRNEDTPGGSHPLNGGEASTQTRRILRRGIPFGASFTRHAPAGRPGAADASFPNDRGLNFLCYQASIEDQFEFIQTAWVNNKDFPNLPELNDGNSDGHDPIISQSVAGREFTLPLTADDVLRLTGIQRWVTTTGGEYFFSPRSRPYVSYVEPTLTR